MSNITKTDLYLFYTQFVPNFKSIDELSEDEIYEAIYMQYKQNPRLIYRLDQHAFDILYELWENNKPLQLAYPSNVLRIPYFIIDDHGHITLRKHVYALLDELFIDLDYDEVKRNFYLKTCLLGYVFCFVLATRKNLMMNMMNLFDDCDEHRFNFLLQLLLDHGELTLENHNEHEYIMGNGLKDVAALLLLNYDPSQCIELDYSETYLIELGSLGFPMSETKIMNLFHFVSERVDFHPKDFALMLNHLLHGAHLYINIEDIVNKIMAAIHLDVDCDEFYEMIYEIVNKLPCGLMNGIAYGQVEFNQNQDNYFLNHVQLQQFSPVYSNLMVYTNLICEKYTTEQLILLNLTIHQNLITYLLDHVEIIDDYINSLDYISPLRKKHCLNFKDGFYDYFYLLKTTKNHVVVYDRQGVVYGCKIFHEQIEHCINNNKRYLKLALIPFDQCYVAFLLSDEIDENNIKLLDQWKDECEKKEMITYPFDPLA